jgi:hypothetical protein
VSVDEAIAGAVKDGVSSAVSKGEATIFTPFIWLWTTIGWQGFISLFLLFFIILGASVQCIQQHSFSPLLYEVGGRLVSADETIYQKVTLLRSNPDAVLFKSTDTGFIPAIKSFWSHAELWYGIITSIWFIYMNFYLINLLVKFINGPAEPIYVNWVWTLYILVTLQMILSLSLFSATTLKNTPIEGNYTETQISSKVLVNIVPFKGVASLGGYLFDNLKNLNVKNLPTT